METNVAKQETEENSAKDSNTALQWRTVLYVASLLFIRV